MVIPDKRITMKAARYMRYGRETRCDEVLTADFEPFSRIFCGCEVELSSH